MRTVSVGEIDLAREGPGGGLPELAHRWASDRVAIDDCEPATKLHPDRAREALIEPSTRVVR